MPPDPRQIEEWLSGLLDGALSEHEQRDLDLAMQNDPSIAQRLEEMTKLRSSLLRGRSVGRLGTDFSKRVVQAARDRASEMDAPPAWILPDAPNAVGPQDQEPQWNEGYSEVDRPFPESIELLKPTSSKSGQVRTHQKVMIQGLMGVDQEATASLGDRVLKLWVPSIAIVLALCALFFLLPRSNDSASQNGTTSVADGVGLPSDPNGSQTQMDPGTLADSTSKDPAPNDNTSVKQPESANQDTANDGLIARTPQEGPAMDPKSTPNPSIPSGSNPLEGKIVEGKMLMALVANITVDPVAAENGMLTQLLNKYEIISSSDAVLETAEVDTLVSSQILKSASNGTATENDKLSVYVVKASLLRLDSFLQDVEKQYADFPGYRLNASVDPTVLKLMDHLVGITDSPQTAKRLVFKDPQTGESSSTIGQPSDLSKPNPEERRNNKGRKDLSQSLSSQQEGYLILLVRQAK